MDADQARSELMLGPYALDEIYCCDCRSLHTKPGDLVLDPFAGSGTTLLAAHDLGRHYLGFEIEQRWVDLARKRLAAAKAQGRFNLEN